ncbi:MAG: DUF6519 domain-containing protein [Alphaproteobacteria bacterium]
MSGDYTRFAFDPLKRYSGVLMQQGRVQLDADWNEEIDIIKRRVRTLSLDAFGPDGVPLETLPDSFLLGLIAGPPPDLSIEPGRLYVDGLLAEYFPEETWTYLAQPFLPDPPALPNGDAVVYLDVWEREVTYIEDAELLDVALGGADTATRTQTVWQLRVEAREGAACGMEVGAPPSAGRLSSEAIAPPAPDDPCILPPVAGYRGLENRLYRVEIHEGGTLGTARFKWSRDNGSIVSAVREMAVGGGETTLTVNRIGRDQVLRFRIDDWVTVTDDHRELMEEPGEMARIVDIDEANRQIVLDRALPTGGGRPFGATAADLEARHTRIQRWDQTAATNTLDVDGLIATAGGPIDLEDGIRISFDMDPVGGSFRNGDYWVFWARTADASIEELDEAPPRGIIHHYLQLAALTGLGGPNPGLTNCRPPEEEEGECCCTVVVAVGESIQAAIDSLPPEGGCVCLKPGVHQVTNTITIGRGHVLLKGESRGVTVRRTNVGSVLAIGNAAGVAVEGIEVETIDFEALAAAEADSGLIVIAGAHDVSIRYCGVTAVRGSNAIGIQIVRSDLVEVRRCAISEVAVGIQTFGLCLLPRFEANRFTFDRSENTAIGIAGIVAQSAPSAHRIEDNTIEGSLYGISLNDQPFGDTPSSSSYGSLIVGNFIACAPLPEGAAASSRLYAIDCAADDCLIAGNRIAYPSDTHVGVRVTGSGVTVADNSLAFLGKSLNLPGAAGVLIGHEGGAVTRRIAVTGNLLSGPQHGILGQDAADLLIKQNIIDSDGPPLGFGVLLSAVRNATVENNRIRQAAGAAITSLNGTNNRVLANDVADGNFGIALNQEIGLAVAQNRLANLANFGAGAIVVMGRCEFVENRLTNCGHSAALAIGIGAYGVIGELHVEANEIMDTGIRPDGASQAALAYGIFGDLILEARIESNLVTYSDALTRDPNREDRALIMRGYLESTTNFGQVQLVLGFAIQIVDNKFIGTGRSALVQLAEAQLNDNLRVRFERVLFHNNYCMHVSPSPDDRVATVVLVGRAATVMGNQIKGTVPGFFSVDFTNMPGPFIGNVIQGPTLRHPAFPAPVGNFNMQL